MTPEKARDKQQRLDRGPLYHKEKWECPSCETPTTCAMYGRCMPIIGQEDRALLEKNHDQ